MRNNTQLTICCALAGMLILSLPAVSNVTTAFGPAQLENAAGTGLLFGSAIAEISVFETTTNGGTIDIALTNTSLTAELESGRFANAFITEFQFDLPDGFVPIFGSCSVIAPVGVRFAQGAGNPVAATGIERILDWDFGTGTGGGMYARAYEADQNGINNVIFSENALNASGIPIEDYAEGFLKNNWDGAVFDTIIFRVCLENSGPVTEDDLSFFADDHLTLKFQGGEGSAWVPNNHRVPEPGTIALIGFGIVALAGIVRRKLC